MKRTKEEKIERKETLKTIKTRLKDAKKGDSFGYYVAGLNCFQLRDNKYLKKSLALYKKGAELNEPHCLTKLGDIYSSGYGYHGLVTIDKKAAADYYSQARSFGHGGASYRLGQIAENEGNYESAFNLYKEANSRGYSEAAKEYKNCYQNMISHKTKYPNSKYWLKWMAFGILSKDLDCMKEGAKLYESGNEILKIKKDMKKAFSIRKELADNNDYESMIWLADYYEKEKDYTNAFTYYARSENIKENGYVLGKIGDYYFRGRAISINYNRAISYFERGTALKDPLSIFGLGKCYYYGYGDEQNYAKAIECFKTAITYNYPSAYLYLGMCYYNEFGVEKNYEEALSYFLKAASLDVIESYNLAGDCFYFGYGTEINYEKALELYLKAVENGQKACDFRIAYCYSEKNTKAGYKKAVEWNLKAIEGPDKGIAYNNLGRIYENGNIGKPDYKKAYHYYNEAYKLGVGMAGYNLGCLYYHGYEVEKDIKEAIKYFEEASNKNILKAKKALVGIYQSKEFHDEKKLVALNEELVTLNDANAMYSMGWNHLEKNEIEKGLDLLKRSAELGNTNAMVSLGSFYANKEYGLDDLEKGRDLFSNAAKNGNSIAKLDLGILYKKERKYNLAIKMLTDNDLTENGQALYLLGDIYEQGLGVSYDLKKAYEYYVQSSKANYAYADYKLGLFYQNGFCVPNNIDLASKYYIKAAESGINDAYYNLGCIYIDSKDLKKAFDCFKAGAMKNDPPCMYKLGLMYHNGEGTKASDVKAKEWCTKASKANDGFVEYLIGLTYYKGEDTEKNDELAYDWFRKAVRNNNTNASFYLGYFYEKGIYVSKNIRKAIDYYQKSTDSAACFNLSLIYSEEGQYKDEKKAFDYALKAYNFGGISASYNLGLYYENGDGVDKDLKKAFAFYNSGATRGNADCQKRLADFYYDGIGIEKNYSEAYKWYQKAYESGVQGVLYDIGWCLYNGQGTSIKYEEAFKCFEKGSELGDDRCTFRLAVCYFTGNGTQTDYKKAFEIFNKFIDTDNDTLYYLGKMYYYGFGVEKDTKKEKNYY